eukprot:m.35779 g.35779  ORF g.35779 m.35779 type:complete len:317 (+) comp5737_c0_seq2:115-1065(+)
MRVLLVLLAVAAAAVASDVHAHHDHDHDHDHEHDDLDLTDRPILYPEDRDDYAKSTTDELKQAMFNLLSAIDLGQDLFGQPAGTAGDDALDLGELAYRVSGVLVSLKHYDAWHHTEELDKDGDGLLSYDEVRVDCNLGDTACRRRFHAADHNEDTWLGSNEVPRFFHPEFFPTMFRTRATELLEVLDDDRDGTITRDEAEHNDMMRVHFSFADVDKNGHIDAVEVIRLLSKENAGRILRTAKRLFKLADTDQDGLLTADELIAQYPLFVGYGIDDPRHGQRPIPEETHEDHGEDFEGSPGSAPAAQHKHGKEHEEL